MKIIPFNGASNDAADPLDKLADQAQSDINAAGAGAPGTEPPGEGEAQTVPPITNAQAVMMSFQIIRDTAAGFAGIQSFKVTLANEKIQPVAEAWAEVLDKYGIQLSDIAGDFMVEIKAAILTLPVLLVARAAMLQELAQRKPKPAAEVVQENAAPGPA